MVPSVGSTVWIERRKWPDDPHYGSEGIVLGEDEHGVWVGAQPGNGWYKGTDDVVDGVHRVVWCVPRDGWFLGHYLADHPEVDTYIDIASPPVWTPRGAKLVDLDFDVIVWNDGRPVELVDEDEFELHRVQLAYPDELVTAARSAAERILADATAGVPPFDGATSARWMDAITALGPAGGVPAADRRSG